MLTYHPVRQLGDVPNGSDYNAWYAWAKSIGAAPVTLPFNVPAQMQPYVGHPAIRLTADQYTQLFNAGQIDPNTPQVASNNRLYVYVVAPQSTWAGAPHVMTTSESAENRIFSGLDTAADTIGLPSLKDIEDSLMSTGKQVLIGVAVALAVGYAGHKLLK